MLDRIIATTVLISGILLIRAIFQGKISPHLQYGLWLLVLIQLLIPGTIGNSPFSIRNLYGTNTTAQAELLHLWGREKTTEGSDVTDQTITGYAAADYIAADSGTKQTAAGRMPEESTAIWAMGQTAFEPTEQGMEQTKEQAAYGNSANSRNQGPVEAAGILFLIWLCGAILLFIVFLWRNLQLYFYLRRTRRKIDCTQLMPDESSKNSRNRVCRLPVYLTGNRLSSPCLFGLFPSIYIPEDAIGSAENSEEQLRFILTHEVMHNRQGDPIWALARIVCLILNWYHPLVWAAARLSVRDGELSCDAACLKRLGEENRIAYGEALLSMLRSADRRERIWCHATMMTSGKNFMKKRICFIVGKQQYRKGMMILAAVLALACAGCTLSDGEAAKEAGALEAAETAGTAASENAVASDTGNPVTHSAAPGQEDSAMAAFDGKLLLVKGEQLESKACLLTAVATPEEEALYRVTLLSGDLLLQEADGGYRRLEEAAGEYTAEEMLGLLNRNLDLALTEYEIWDYEKLAALIDAAGGVAAEMEADDLERLNQYSETVRKEMELTADASLFTEESGTLSGAEAVTWALLRHMPDSYEQQNARWEQVLQAALSAAGMTVYDVEDFFADYGDVIYREEEENGCLLNLEWEGKLQQLHMVLYPDQAYKPSQNAAVMAQELSDRVEQYLSEVRADAGQTAALFNQYMGYNYGLVSRLLTGGSLADSREAGTAAEWEDAWSTLQVWKSGMELYTDEEAGRAVYLVVLQVKDAGVTGLAGTDGMEEAGSDAEKYATVMRFLYLVRREDGWYADGPYHNNLPPADWWNGGEISSTSCHCGFSDEKNIGIVTTTSREYDIFIREAREAAAQEEQLDMTAWEGKGT